MAFFQAKFAASSRICRVLTWAPFFCLTLTPDAIHAQEVINKQNTQSEAGVPQVQLPSSQVMVILIRSSVLALGQATVTNNYTVLNELGSHSFQSNNPPALLANVFQSFRTSHIDLSPVVYIDPQLTAPPVLANGRMRLVGIFPSKPMQVNFDLTFEPDEGAWKLFGLSVNLTPAPQTIAGQAK